MPSFRDPCFSLHKWFRVTPHHVPLQGGDSENVIKVWTLAAKVMRGALHEALLLL